MNYRPGSEFKTVHDFDGARAALRPAERLAEVRRRAENFRARLLAQDNVRYYRSIDLVAAPYPVRYGLRDATTALTPYLNLMNRLFVVQYDTRAGVKTLLFSPSDTATEAEPPFIGEFAGVGVPLLEKVMVPFRRTVEEALTLTGISPAQVDYIAYDHLYAQDLRRWLGTHGRKGYFPNAKLLVMRAEWEAVQAPLPTQAMWHCPGGAADVDVQKVILLDQSVELGDGLALIHTPGHTEGNMSLVAKTPDGLLVTSANGIAADSYAPLASQISGVRDHAKRHALEVIMNSNTLECANDQYLSMVVEKTIAGPAKENPEFFNVVPSSELAANLIFPGLKPTFRFGERSYGTPLTV